MSVEAQTESYVTSAVVIGTSAGGLEVLRRLVRGLEPGLPAAFFVVQHLYHQAVSQLPQILTDSGPLPAVHPQDGQQIEAGCIYIAPPDFHLLVNLNGTVTLNYGPRENLHRPAIDPLFRSAARVFGMRTIGILLSGTKDDGVAGLLAIQLRGGHTVVQDPDDAPYPEMPRNALEQLSGIDYVVPVAVMPSLIGQLVQELAPAATQAGGQPVSPVIGEMHKEAARLPEAGVEDANTGGMDVMKSDSMPTDPLATEPDVLICPECGGALTPIHHERLLQYRCHTGHIFGAQSLEVAYAEKVEHALWAAMSALKERAVLNERLAQRTTIAHLRVEYERQAEEARRQAQVVQELIAGFGGLM